MDNPVLPCYAHSLDMAVRYFRFETTGANHEGTHSVISTLNTIIGSFKSGMLHTLFCTDSTYCSEMTHHGAIILLDIPVESYKMLGIQAQVLMKYMFQEAAKARVCKPDTRPIFLWTDEAQFFYTEQDNQFQSISRSSKVCSVYLTQNIEGFKVNERYVQNFIANFSTKLFLTNSCPKTNKFASDMIGRVKQIDRSGGINTGTNHGESRGDSKGYARNSGSSGTLEGRTWQDGSNSSWGVSSQQSTGRSTGYSNNWQERMDNELEPNIFVANLRTGSPENRCIVDGIMVKNGGFRGGRRFLPVSFFQ